MSEQSSDNNSSDGSDESHNDSVNVGSSTKESHDENKDEGENAERDLDGSVAIIHYENQETGEVEFYLEEKPTDYRIEKYRKKLSFIGGAIDTTDKGSLEALVRELTEEVGSSEARTILINYLYRNGKVFQKIVENFESKEVVTYIYSIKVDSKEEWNKVKSSYLTHDAGSAKVLKLTDALKMREDSFAFGMCSILQNTAHSKCKAIFPHF